jgi:predicted Zn-dependent protease with MMP-like domain/Flp pilus assembly protein TadD
MSDPEDVLQRIDHALASGEASRALVLAEDAARDHPEDPEVRHALGVALRGLERFDEALDQFAAATRLDPGQADAWLDAAEVLVEELGDDVRALDVLAGARKRLREPQHLAEVELLRGIALANLEDYTGALRALDEAAGLDPEHPDVGTERGAVLIELLRLEEAEAALRSAIRTVPEDARAHSLLAFVLDYTGRREESAKQFARAGELDSELPSAPPRLSEEEFDQVLDAAVSAIPEPFAVRLREVEIGVENYADKEFCRRHDCSPTTLGIYVGTPLPSRDATASAQLPDRIVLFQRALENSCETREELIEEIGVTLKHEVGHLLGFSEAELHERGYE